MEIVYELQLASLFSYFVCGQVFMCMLLSCHYVDMTIHFSCSYFVCSFTADRCMVSLVPRRERAWFQPLAHAVSYLSRC